MTRMLVLVLAAAGCPLTLHAQDLPLKRAVPPVEWTGCPYREPSSREITDADRVAAEALANEAAQALILGDHATALTLLTNAAERDARAERIAYRRARTLELLERGEDALTEYCRYLRLAPSAPESAEVRERIEVLVAARVFTVSALAASAFASGITHFEAGRMVQAEAAFNDAAAAAPAWAATVYNRGVVRLALGHTADAGRDLRQYIQMNPGAPDLGAVLDAVGSLQAEVRAPRNAGAALAAGLLMPGLGHFTTGRPTRGAVFLGAAATMVGAGLLLSRSAVECLSPPAQGHCPPEQVLRETTERPFLLPALLAAAATGVYGAIDAYRGARNHQEGAARAGNTGGLSLGRPAIGAGPAATDFTILRLQF